MADDNNPNEELPADGEPNQDSAEQQVSDATRGEKPKRPRIELGPSRIREMESTSSL